MTKKNRNSGDSLEGRAKSLGLWGLLAHWDEVGDRTWARRLIEWEEHERGRRSLDRRIRTSRIGRFKPMADFDWKWPKKIDRAQIDELFTFRFIEERANVILVGPNGIGKSMIAQNLAHQALLGGRTVLFTTAAKMLGDLVVQDTSTALQRRLQRYCRPEVLVVDEVGYLSYDNRHADLLFEVVTRRYTDKPTIVTTNKVFAEWNDVFPSAACVVTLIDRLVHNSEIVEIKGESYRLKEAKERAAKRARGRSTKNKSNKQKKGGYPLRSSNHYMLWSPSSLATILA
jgi:DNA replication protein DnaC